jgi:hypothetical protein
MKPRKWVFFFFFFACLCAGALFLGVRHLERSKTIEQFLSQNISPAIGGHFNVGAVKLGFLSLYLRRVSISLPLRGLTIAISDIKIGFSLWKFMRSRGDLARSISKFILIRPEVNISLLAEMADSAAPASGPLRIPLVHEFPVQQLLVRQGVVAVVSPGGDRIVFGDQLDGRIWENPEGVGFELQGKIASRKRNLSLAGHFSNRGERHRISLRIDRAGIDRPLQIKGVTITGGMLDGVCEVILSDTLTPDNIESRGWIRVENGTCSIDGIKGAVSPITAGLTLSGTTWRVDSLRWGWQGCEATGGGSWDLAAKGEGNLQFVFTRLRIDTLISGLPPEISSAILGDGWCKAAVTRSAGCDTTRVHLSGGGISVWGLPVTAIESQVSLRYPLVNIDSASVEGTRFKIALSGSADFGQTGPAQGPAFQTRFRFSADSLPMVPLLHGSYEAGGSLQGNGDTMVCKAVLSGDNLRYDSLLLGSLRLNCSLAKKKLSFASSGDDPRAALMVSGACEGIGTKHPVLTCKAAAGRQLLSQLTRKMPDALAGQVSITEAEAALSGVLPAMNLSAALQIKGALANGGVRIKAKTEDPARFPVFWQIRDDNLRFSNNNFPLRASGKTHGDSLTIDSLRALNGLSGSGSIISGRQPRVEATIDLDSVSITALNAWFTGGKSPLREGFVSGLCHLSGSPDNLISKSQVHLRRVNVGGITSLAADAVVFGQGPTITVLPTVIRKDDRAFILLDSLVTGKDLIRVSGSFDNVNIRHLLSQDVLDDYDIQGMISGHFQNSGNKYPVRLSARSNRIRINEWKLDSLRMVLDIDTGEATLVDLRAADSVRSVINGSGVVPYSSLDDQADSTDTARIIVSMSGDLLATVGANLVSPLGGTGRGDISATLEASSGEWRLARASATIPHGNLLVIPFVNDKVENFSLSMTVNDSSQIETAIKGIIKRRPITITSSHQIPPGFEPIKIGLLDFGVFLVRTPEAGVDLHVPGFMALKELGDIEFAAKPPFPAFALSGPVDRLKITGTWVIRSLDFTFPLLNEKIPGDFDPFPYITWDLDVKPGNRKVLYYWDLRTKKRNLIRFFEANLEQSALISVCGRDLDKSFKLYGNLRSNRGAVYFGKVFDRNLDVALEFAPLPLPRNQGFDNFPIVSGKAEAFSDSSRFNRITLTLKIIDPATEAISEKGRIAMIPATAQSRQRSDSKVDSIPNFSFHVSSPLEDIAGESEREFFKEAGLQFTSLEGAGGFVSNLGEQYLHRYLLQRFERRLAKSLGLDVITVETSIASNYFYYLQNRQLDELRNQWNLLANMGITVGRYFFNDYLFLKARGELVPSSDSLVKPEYSVGLEFMPTQFLLMDVNYGFSMNQTELQPNPRVQLQLQLPIARMRKLLDF